MRQEIRPGFNYGREQTSVELIPGRGAILSGESAALPQPDWRTHECASTDGTVIKYRIMGKRGMPLVIVHGGASSAQPQRTLKQ